LSGPRSERHAENGPPVHASGFFFPFCGARQPVDGAFQAGAFMRGRCNRRGIFRGPLPLEPSLEIKRNIPHNQSSASVQVSQRASSLKVPPQSALLFKAATGEPFGQRTPAALTGGASQRRARGGTKGNGPSTDQRRDRSRVCRSGVPARPDNPPRRRPFPVIVLS